MAKARSVANYTLAYTGEKSVSPFSSTIISSVVYPTAAAASCAKRCDSNPFCASIELFVERAPTFTPEPATPNPAPAYQFVCRLHNKALGASDAKHAGRFYYSFYRTQTNVLFQNRKSFKKVYGAKLDKACTSDSSCGAGFTCSTTSKKCKLAVGQPCSSGQDDSKCVTGLCSSTGSFGRTQCIVKDQKSVSKDKHCLSNSDCESQNCVSSTKVCGAKALKATCFDHFECETQFCAVKEVKNGRNVGECAKFLKADGQACQASEECKSEFCDSLTKQCGRRKNGEACSSANDCLINACDSEKKICGLSDGSKCTKDDDCVNKSCKGDSLADQSESLKCQSPAPPPKKLADGESCGADEQCLGGYCDTYEETCGRRANGKQCNTANDCVSGACDPKNNICGLANGTPCTDDADCASDQCTNERCEEPTGPPKLANGEQCSAKTDCQSNRCDTSLVPAKCGAAAGLFCTASSECSIGVCDMGALGGARCGKADGTTCSTNAECSSSLCDKSANPAFCKAVPVACNDDSQCKNGSYCDLDKEECVPPRNNGDKCTKTSECKSGSICDPDKKICGIVDGSVCTQGIDCISGTCTEGLKATICKSSTTPPKLANGEACNAAEDCQSGECDLNLSPPKCGKSSGQACSQGTQCATLTCDLAAPGGGGCGKPLTSDCSSDAVCSSTYCRFDSMTKKSVCDNKKIPDGQACPSDDFCESGYCGLDKKCGALNRENGAECAANKECASNNCSTTSSPAVCMPILPSCESTFDCDDKSYCANGKCVPRLNQGEVCQARRDCKSTLSCRIENTSIENTSNENTSTKKCSTGGSQYAPCAATDECNAQLQCVNAGTFSICF